MSYLKHKPGSIEEIMANSAKKLNDNAYQDMFKKELEKAGKGIGSMSPKEKKDFFNKIDDKYKAKNEAVDNPYAVGMAAAMKKTGDKPPLKKSTITKAHDIAKSIEKDQKKEVKESDAYDNNRYMMKKYGGQILARPDNSNTKDGKDHVYAPNSKIAKQLYKQGKKVYREEADHEVSMARGELEAIADKATQLAGALQGKSDEGNPLEAWVQSKITKAKDYINSVSDYLTYDPSMKQNEETEVNEVNIKKVDGKKGFDFKGQFITDPTMDPSGRFDVDPKKYYKLNDKQIKDLKEEVNEKTYGWTLVSKAKDLAKKFKDNITKAVAEIEKLEKGLSKNPTVDAELRKYNENLEEKYTVVITKKDGSTMELGRYNTPAEAQRYVDMYGKGAKVKKEEVELDEIDEKISDIFKANKEGESVEDIAKRLKLSTSMVKKLIGEAKDKKEKKRRT